jgi:hypothetical protein
MLPDFVPVYVASGYLAGQMVRLLLESFDIPAVVSQESAGISLALTVGPLGEDRILVPAGRLEEAREILSAMEEGKLASPYYPGRLPIYPVYKNNKMGREEIVKDPALDGF